MTFIQLVLNTSLKVFGGRGKKINIEFILLLALVCEDCIKLVYTYISFNNKNKCKSTELNQTV